MRKIEEIIIHCADTPAGRDVRAEDIRSWHKNEHGWTDIGYHYIIDIDGTIEPGRDVATPGAHCSNHNAKSIGICYVGGRAKDSKDPEDTRTEEQKAALLSLLKYLVRKYPGAKIYGHKDFAPKACPCFDAKTEYAELCE